MTTSATPEQREQALIETKAHIRRVHQLLHQVARDLAARGLAHDASKLEDPELDGFAQLAGLRDLVYGSDEYKQKFKEGPGPATIAHHYAENDHHPEFFPDGLWGMNLMQVTEMLCDWKAASERHNNQPFAKSFPINRKRFGIEDQLFAVLVNTALALGFISSEELPIAWGSGTLPEVEPIVSEPPSVDQQPPPAGATMDGPD